MSATTNEPKVEIEVVAWSGNYRPFRAVVKIDGKWAGVTGGTATRDRAQSLGIALAAKLLRKRSE